MLNYGHRSFAQSSRKMTAVGAEFEPGNLTNGLLVAVPEQSLAAFDTREQGYSRKLLDKDQVEVLLHHGTSSVPRTATW